VRLSTQPRVPASSPNGGEFAPKNGAISPTIHAEAKDVELESVGKFKLTDPDIVAGGGLVSEGEIEINAFTKYTDPEDKAEGLSAQYFMGMAKETLGNLDEDAITSIIAQHAEHVAKGGSAAVLDILGTKSMLYSDPATPELLNVLTQKEYDEL
jgi:hypothetical protein